MKWSFSLIYKQCSTKITCSGDCVSNQELCVASDTFLTGKGCTKSTENNIDDFVVATGGMDAKNVVRRTIRYGVNKDAVDLDLPDFQAITGGDCSDLRGITLSINGNKMSRDFLKEQHESASAYWQELISDTRKLIETVTMKITNLKGINHLFYPLETAPTYQCDSSFGGFEYGINLGDADGPKCDQAGMDYSTAQGLTTQNSLTLRRDCFCRSFKATSTDTHSVDELYLRTSKPTTAICNEYKTTLPSVFTFCRKFTELGDVDAWKSSLARLGANKDDMPTGLDAWYTVSNNNGKTGRDEVATAFDDSIEGSGTQCGRVSSASTTSVSFSNKGGNCIPLLGVDSIVYQLEHEFLSADAATDRKGSGVTYGEMTCAPPNAENVFSFRELAYRWQRYNVTGTNGYPLEGETNDDNIDTGIGQASQFYDNSANNYEDMCNVDYAQILGGGKVYMDGTVTIADPLKYLGRLTGEAAYMTDISHSKMNKINLDAELLYNHLFTELTSTERDGINSRHIINDIGKKAASHFMASSGHDGIAGFTALCSQSMSLGTSINAKQYKHCTVAEYITMSVTGTASVGAFGLLGATNLRNI